MERSTLTATVDQFSKNGQQYFGQSIGSFVATAQLMGVRAQGIAAIATPNDQRRSFKGRYQAQQRAFIKSGCTREISQRNGLGPLGNCLDNRQGSIDGRYATFSRSEEHTSELQSLMRTSYAVFCLTKKKKRTKKH